MQHTPPQSVKHMKPHWTPKEPRSKNGANAMNLQTTHPNPFHARPGFSLIELTAVLVILGLLMAGAAVAVPGQIKKARIRTTKNSMTVIKTQIEAYRAEQAGDAPASLAVLVPLFMEEKSLLDSWQQEYYYLPTPGSPQHAYTLISSGPDKELSTEDDINLWTMDVSTAN